MPFASVQELRSALLASDPFDFVSEYLFEPIPHVFSKNLRLWIDWKMQLAEHLEVDPYEMVLTGSGAVGYSLSPSKSLAAFQDESDIDVGVVSLHHFEVAWRYLRRSRPSWLSLPPATRRALDSHRKNYVFAGTIATDYILPLLPFGKRWQDGLDDMATLAPTVDREVKLRVYRDFDSLRSYQAAGIRALRDAILAENETDEEIPQEEA